MTAKEKIRQMKDGNEGAARRFRPIRAVEWGKGIRVV